jgi:hypothetical protein
MAAMAGASCDGSPRREADAGAGPEEGHPTNRAGARVLIWALIACAAAVLLAEAAYAVRFADTLYDEGGYLYEGWLSVARGWRPYHDFHTKVTPLLYYFYGVPQALWGPSLLLGRAQAAVSSLLALGLATVAVGRRYGPQASLAVLVLFASALLGLDQHFRALAVAPCALWVALGLLGISLGRGRAAWVVTGLAAGLVFLTRQDLVAVAVALLVGCGLACGSLGAAAWSALAALVTALIGIAPFLAHPSPQLLSVLSLGLVKAGPALGAAPFARTEEVRLGLLPWYAMYLGRAYVGPLLLLLPGFAALSTTSVRALVARHPLPATALLAAGANLAVRGAGAFAQHANAFYLRDFYIEMALIAGAAAVVAAAWTRATEARHRSLLAALAVGALVLGPVCSGIPEALRPRRPAPLQALALAGRFIAQRTDPGDRIFSIEDPQAFLEAGRELLPPLVHHLFLYRRTVPAGWAHPTEAFDLPMLMDMLRRQATVVVLTAHGLTWVEHTERTAEGAAIVRAVRAEVAARWVCVAQVPNPYLGAIAVYRRRGPGLPRQPVGAGPSG